MAQLTPIRLLAVKMEGEICSELNHFENDMIFASKDIKSRSLTQAYNHCHQDALITAAVM
jgi:hypothetical protein